MNKSELVARVAAKSGLSNTASHSAVNAFMESVKDALASGDNVTLIGFGTFEVRDRAARTARNPRTREEITIPASKLPAFRAGKTFKAQVNE
ncbi:MULTISPECIES: HU family DNA-binding protein [unclassified Anaerobiospirillum]|uniref:HU family DNA-binding protein n=1 Tax=unclassified Anaerobiospirillum TaxID=2647410 RepID=UPI001FF2797B|nr:HU family DNA-binding protein [Anaerobiospirillum sp. NML120449]MCK0534557.1 HU family DNA-binding protein [Anaerobiospirillum sp. NML120511]MCK0540640.1 HU family DNA-binding protein [Anaerobiospirillum sp. NML02-A-032]